MIFSQCLTAIMQPDIFQKVPSLLNAEDSSKTNIVGGKSAYAEKTNDSTCSSNTKQDRAENW